MCKTSPNGTPALQNLTDHCVWANHRWIEHVAASLLGDLRAVRLVSHILLGERAWFDRLAGREPDPALWGILSVEAQREMHRTHASRYREWLAGDLGARLSYTRFTGEQYTSSVGDILRHLVTHGAHHRGQLAAHVSASGGTVINTDFLCYCMEHGL